MCPELVSDTGIPVSPFHMCNNLSAHPLCVKPYFVTGPHRPGKLQRRCFRTFPNSALFAEHFSVPFWALFGDIPSYPVGYPTITWLPTYPRRLQDKHLT